MDAIRERDEDGRRPLTVLEREELLDLPLVGIWSTLSPTGRIHSVPVHFVWRDGDLRVLTEQDSVKCRNARRTGRATFCVETAIDRSDRRFVTIEGTVRVEQTVSRDDSASLAERYHWQDDGLFDQGAYVDSVMLVLEPERWIAWSDAD